jgi:hypothetical protein
MRLRGWLVVGIFFIAASGCARMGGSPAEANWTTTPAGTNRAVISGDEALELYGVMPRLLPEDITPAVQDESWFPTDAWVSASVLPYDDAAPIRILPVYSDPTLDVGGIWLGDLAEAAQVRLLGVDQAGRACYVAGNATQGWDVEGWVACNRILFERPTQAPIVEGLGR